MSGKGCCCSSVAQFWVFLFLDKLRLVHEKVKAMFSNFTINAHPMAIMVSCKNNGGKLRLKPKGWALFWKGSNKKTWKPLIWVPNHSWNRKLLPNEGNCYPTSRYFVESFPWNVEWFPVGSLGRESFNKNTWNSSILPVRGAHEHRGWWVVVVVFFSKGTWNSKKLKHQMPQNHCSSVTCISIFRYTKSMKVKPTIQIIVPQFLDDSNSLLKIYSLWWKPTISMVDLDFRGQICISVACQVGGSCGYST